ncbi:hypothetical protein A2W54_02850 [Candidatus Giovannonibacteria bacterium RIFCSPHIGHO2_02_43_13]|uniref:DNA polymerase III subunit delta n=1 Tax=Candidatus Giovannonibacteria bacterium RIFCSPHIGHO2_02_43_13 TaxID=1798330 RepID=A0A1F5WR06_9BACT|nr:MAG: putative DNA-directed DNA polymerase [Parcubacteria group bacterium GW2011_GWA2_44_13]OGF72530.1 MAG: hypothetical protein A3E06_03980 [Candidatus Giovannonibacteria bacterium RIFCSPHIGHO2_12_FULL_44_42]OGF77681.1 MAG: hypothetical protein A2W54_02850 [Candidatus Giovannonibacteria bacterium RIFCSPHIGHO2_02_43_13]OGF88973.1 MAG: hypothetical protein A3I94_03640 [Candidatus Giovannonibacteria bacterium RIFCSPLOWO2_02_FULL_43_54]OGF97409.1 MAG: hypothetical protein A3H08_03990 [Candidatus
MRPLELIKCQLAKKTLPHAYLFSGTDEMAKNEATECIFVELLKVELKKIGNHPDFYQVESDPITIDDVRVLKSKASVGPLVGKRCVFYIKKIENLSWQAAPALLKLLEEPGPNSFILASTENANSVLPTLRSRFAHIKFTGRASSKKIEKPAIPKKAPEGDEAAAFLMEALNYARVLAKKESTRENVSRFSGLLKAVSELSDPTVNKRLLAEYAIMLL